MTAGALMISGRRFDTYHVSVHTQHTQHTAVVHSSTGGRLDATPEFAIT